MSSKLEELTKIKQAEINRLDSAIKEVKHYLETIESLIQVAEKAYIQAKQDLTDAKALVDANIAREKRHPPLKTQPRWESIVQEAKQNQTEKLEHYNGWEKNYKETKAKYEKHSKKLREYEDKRKEMAAQLIILCVVAQNAEAKELKPVSDQDLAKAKDSFLKTEYPLPRPK